MEIVVGGNLALIVNSMKIHLFNGLSNDIN